MGKEIKYDTIPVTKELMKWCDFSALVEKYGMSHNELIYVNEELSVAELIEVMKDRLSECS